MATPEEIVRSFWKSMEEDGIPAAKRKFLHPDVVKEDSGFGKTVGLEMTLLATQVYLSVFHRPIVRAEIHNLAVNGNTVLTERTEHNINPENGDVFTGKLMSVFVIEDDKIIRWAEYYDPTPYRYGRAMPRTENTRKLMKMWAEVNRQRD